MATEQNYFCLLKQHMGSQHYRPLCNNGKHATAEVQQQVCRTKYLGDQCSGTNRLENRGQLCKLPLSHDTRRVSGDKSTGGCSNHHCPGMEGTTVVQAAQSNGNRHSISFAAFNSSFQKPSSLPRTTKKHEMENICLENLWKEKLTAVGWAPHLASIIRYTWAESTLHTYNNFLMKFANFCETNLFVFICPWPKHIFAYRPHYKIYYKIYSSNT